MKRPEPLPRDPKHPYGSPEHNLSEEELSKRFPYAITLRFYDKYQAEQFIGQLLDGWGESHCDLAWSGWGSGSGKKLFACLRCDGDDQ